MIDMYCVKCGHYIENGTKFCGQCGNECTTSESTSGDAVGVEPLLKRMFIFLEDGEWDMAKEYSNRVLDIEPENANAYLGSLMSFLKVHTAHDLCECAKPFDELNDYKRIMRFGDED